MPSAAMLIGGASSSIIEAHPWIWLKWSWRDLRSRWGQVATIAFVIVPGGGILAQRLTGIGRKVNDLMLRLEPEADEDALYSEMSDRFSQLGGTVIRRQPKVLAR